MADRLPFGEIRPGARPLGSFIRPADVQVAGAAKPAMLSAPSGVVQLQQGSGGSYQGYNQFEQLATALGPFSKNLQNVMETGIAQYAKSQIEAGYYREAKNAQARANLTLQMQQEQGSANAAGQITQLQKVDPASAELLKEANPFKAIGRRRFLAQMASAEVGGALQADLATNAGKLAGIAPGSAELISRKATLTSQVMNRYGLSGDELEAQYYVVPSINEGWDKYTAQHSKLYTQELARTTTEAAGGAVNGLLVQMLRNGITLQDGTKVMPGDPRFAQLGGLMLTQQLDQSLVQLAGDDKKKALDQIYGTLAFLSNDPTIEPLVREVRVGSSKDPLDKRPRIIDANPVELLEMQNKGMTLRTNSYELKQKGIGQQLDGAWYGADGPGAPGVVKDSADYKERVQKFRQLGLDKGFMDVDGYIQKKDNEATAAANAAFGQTAEDKAAVDEWIRNLGPDAFKPENIGALRKQADAYAMAEATGDARTKRRKELQDMITEREKLMADLPPGSSSQIKGEIKRDLGLKEIKALDPKGQAGFLLLQPGMSVSGAMAAADQRLATYATRLENLYTRSVQDGMDEYRRKNPGVTKISDAQQNIIIDRAIAKARLSNEYTQIFNEATGKGNVTRPAADGGVTPQKPSITGAQGPAPAAKASSLSDATVRQYRDRPVMDGRWVYNELSAIKNGKPVSPELYNTARRAGTSTSRYLLEQLRYFPQLDPKGEWSNWLQQKVTRERQGQTISSANYSSMGLGMVPTGYNSFSPGSWLMNMIAPPAAAATIPTTTRGGGGADGGYRGTPPAGARNALVSVAQQLGIRPVDLAAVISLETGGSFNKDIKGGEGGNYQGLIQFGPSERKTYGYRKGMSFEEQLAGPVFRYLKARGVRPGHGVQEIYAAILTGNVANIKQGGLDWKDSFGTSVRGALPSLTKGGHYKNALRFLGS